MGSKSSVKHQNVHKSAEIADATPRLLLTREAVPDILKLFDLPEAAARDIYRAIEQARNRSTDKPVQ